VVARPNHALLLPSGLWSLSCCSARMDNDELRDRIRQLMASGDLPPLAPLADKNLPGRAVRVTRTVVGRSTLEPCLGRAIILLTAMALACGCANTTTTAIPTGAGRYAASSQIETYITGNQLPPRPYEQVGIIKGHYSAATAWGSAEVTDVLPELHARAREMGAEAVLVTNVNRYLGRALNPMVRTIPNIDVVALAIRYLPASAVAPPLTVPTPSPALTSVSLADAVERVAPSVVRVRTDRARGSGVVVDPAGGILTAAHVVKGAKTITVEFSDGRRTTASIRSLNIEADVALLNIPLTNLPTARIGSSQSLRPGEDVAALGAPLGLASTVTRGIVSAVRAQPDGVALIQTDAAINPGNSGGPLINLRGEVVGISSFKLVDDQAQGLGFAVAADAALARLGAAQDPAKSASLVPTGTQLVAAAISVTGTYSGNISGTQAGRGFAMTVVFTIAQQGERVSATWITSGGTSGTLTGLLRGSQILEFVANQAAPCPGSLRGSVAVGDQGSVLSGSYAGEGCGMPVSAAFIVNRQP